ncbi:MAG: diaminopimelate epimerase [Actinomycetota bacterium]|nr:diaminopimelate epimerase [Actinomycetota bacterium]
MLIDFTKSQGLGNDFIIIDDLDGALDISPAMVRGLCDRHFGVGADGLIVTKRSSVGDYFMDFRNADGSLAEMCGNGIRAFAKYVYERHHPRPVLNIETLAGLKTVELTVSDGNVASVRVDMGRPIFANADIPVLADGDDFIDRPLVLPGSRRVAATCLSMGNPHCVIFVDDLDEVDVAADGAGIENLDIFPKKTNVEFVRVLADDRLKVKVWERGVGATLACGTGACAALVAAGLNGLAGREATVELPGGELIVSRLENEHVILAGAVVEVFTGRLNIEKWSKQGEMD